MENRANRSGVGVRWNRGEQSVGAIEENGFTPDYGEGPRWRGLVKLAGKGAQVYGLDPARLLESVKSVPYFIRSLRIYRRQQACVGGSPLMLRYLQPHLADRHGEAGTFDAEYFYQDWWVARDILHRNPKRHIDIGSRLDGFVSHLLVFRDVEFVDVRPLTVDIPSFASVKGDARSLNMYSADSVDSVSCLHAIEHIGLGRYGDQIDPLGPGAVAKEICRVLRPGGCAYISAPIGTERLSFNAQRVFAPQTMLRMFGELTLEKFSAVDDAGRFQEDVLPGAYAGARDACGIFVFRKDIV